MAVTVAALYLIAYHTYGKFLAKKIYRLDNSNITPAEEINDRHDYVPTKKEILFGHHFTSIAGTGPIVGPAIGIIWGWLPAILWVVFGSILMGAVHDFGTLIISIRNKGKSIGDASSSIISPRVRIMFLCIICMVLLILIAVFCLVVAVLFDLYPQSVISIWFEIPLAIWLGYMIYTRNKSALKYSLIALVLLYVSVLIGSYVPLEMPQIGPLTPVAAWTIILLIYAFIASTLPVHKLLQPRDYINGHELFVAMGLLALGIIVARPEIVAPAINTNPEGAPPFLPFLFITIACGAISGFHGLVGSGTSSKQISKESDALPIGYGGMLMEGMLATFVIIATCAGIGYLAENGITGAELWHHHYASWGEASGLGAKVRAFVEGSANILTSFGIPRTIGITIMGVFVASFAGTSLDTATRLQRYVVSELSSSLRIRIFSGKYVATLFAVVTGGLLALHDGKGKGGLLLWPLFGGSNQLLACLALLVITVYLAKKGRKIIFTIIPFFFMLVMTGWAMFIQLGNYFSKSQWLLFSIGLVVAVLELWMLVEAYSTIKGLSKKT